MGKKAPLYRQVKLQLIELLRQGKWRHGQKTPSEPVLARRFSCSIGTLRRAMGELVSENLLERQQGRGTFVRTHSRDYMLDVFFKIAQRDGSKELPAVEVLSVRRNRATDGEAKALGIKPRASVLRIESVLTLHGEPVIFDRMVVARALFPDLTQSQFARRDGTVYGFFQERYGVSVVRIDEFITAVCADGVVARRLAIRSGTPLLRIERVAFAFRNEPVDVRVRFVRCDRYGYLSTLGGTRQGG
jgi:GntR family transcriptional regulator